MNVSVSLVSIEEVVLIKRTPLNAIVLQASLVQYVRQI